MDFKEQIAAYAAQIGIDKIGFAQATQTWQKDKYEEYLRLGYSCGFENQDIVKRYALSTDDFTAATIIAVAIAFPPYQAPVNEYEARFCAASVGIDYHAVMNEKLNDLGEFLLKLVPGSQYKIAADTGNWSDREIAVLCGLGWIGKNSNLVTKDYGSFVYLGEIIWDVPLEAPLKLVEDHCLNCDLCVRACPMLAIDDKRRMVDTRRCLAYKTLDKNYPTEETIAKIAANGYIYGCDVCQLACPYNQWLDNDKHIFWQENRDLAACDVWELLKMSNKEFKQKYGSISGSWRGKNVLIRNGIWILGARRLPELRELWQEIAAGDNENLRLAARWALAQYDEE